MLVLYVTVFLGTVGAILSKRAASDKDPTGLVAGTELANLNTAWEDTETNTQGVNYPQEHDPAGLEALYKAVEQDIEEAQSQLSPN